MSAFVPVPVPHCFDHCSFIVLSEVWEGYASCFFPCFDLFFSPEGALAMLGLLWFQINLRIICSSSVKNVMRNLIGFILNL